MHSMSILRCIQELTKYYAYVQENATLAKGNLKLVVYSEYPTHSVEIPL